MHNPYITWLRIPERLMKVFWYTFFCLIFHIFGYFNSHVFIIEYWNELWPLLNSRYKDLLVQIKSNCNLIQYFSSKYFIPVTLNVYSFVQACKRKGGLWKVPRWFSCLQVIKTDWYTKDIAKYKLVSIFCAKQFSIFSWNSFLIFTKMIVTF